MFKRTFILALLLPVLGKAQSVEGEYKIVDSLLFHSFVLRNDFTFLLKDRGHGCMTWSDYEGIWYQKNGTLILIDSIIGQESVFSEYQIPKKETQKDILIRFIDQYDNALSNYELFYEDSETGEKDTLITDINGECHLKTIYSEELRTRGLLAYGVVLKNGKSAYHGLDINENTGVIIIQANMNPNKWQRIIRLKFSIDGDTLKLISNEDERLGPHLIEGALFVK